MLAFMEVTTQEAQQRLPELLTLIEDGEEVFIVPGGDKVFRLTAEQRATTKRNIWGNLEGKLTPEFDDIPEEFKKYT